MQENLIVTKKHYVHKIIYEIYEIWLGNVLDVICEIHPKRKWHIKDAKYLTFRLKSAYDLGLILCHPKEGWKSLQLDAFSQCTGQLCSLASFSPHYEVPESRR